MPGQLAHPVPFTVTGNAPGVYAPVALPGVQPQVEVFGLTVTNTTATAASVVVRDGAGSGPGAPPTTTGNVLVAANVPAAVAGAPGVADIDHTRARRAVNGIYIEVDGGAATGVVWVA